MNTTNEIYEEFFHRYERATASNDSQAIEPLYAESFVFGSPTGTQILQKKDFLALLPRRSEFVKKSGLVRTEVSAIKSAPISEEYSEATVTWTITVQNGKDERKISVLTTYILTHHTSNLQIIMQIDHQDLIALLQTVN